MIRKYNSSYNKDPKRAYSLESIFKRDHDESPINRFRREMTSLKRQRDDQSEDKSEKS
jgi:hypothetical protein